MQLARLHININIIIAIYMLLLYSALNALNAVNARSKRTNSSVIRKYFNRPLWYDPPKFWSNYAGGNGDDSSQQLFDIYSLTHIIHGILFYHVIKGITGIANPIVLIVYTLIAEIIWEMIENTEYVIHNYRREYVSRNYPGDSWVNTLGDVWMTYIGAIVASTTSIQLQVIIVTALEVGLYYIKGDNFITNLIFIVATLNRFIER